MADLKLVVDTTDLKTARKDLESFQRSMSNLTVNKYISSLQQAQGSLRQLSKAKSDGVITNKQYELGVKQVTESLRRLGMTQNQAEGQIKSYLGGLNKQTTAMQRNTRGINNMGVQMQQTGYQVGDFIVQVQSGTNWMVAFGQQATQVAGTLTLLGGKYIAIGSALGVLIPLTTALGAAWIRTGDQGTDAIQNLEDRIKSLREELTEYQRTQEAVLKGLTVSELDLTKALEDNAERIEKARVRLEGAKASALASPDGGQSFILLLMALKEQAAAGKELEDLEKTRIDLQDRLKSEQTKNFLERFKELNQEIDLNHEILRFGEKSSQVEELRSRQERANYAAEIALLREKKEITEAQAEDLLMMFDAAKESEKEVEKLNSALTLVGGLDLPITIKINLLKQELGLAADEAARLLENLPSDPLDPFGGEGDRGYSEPSTFNKPDKKTKRGGSGKSLGEIIKQRSEQIQQELELIQLSGRAANIKRIQLELERSYGQELTVNQEKAIQGAVREIAAYEERLEALKNLQEQQQSLSDTIESALSDSLMSIVDGTKTTEEAFKDMARSIIKKLYEILVVQQLVGSFDAGTGKGTGLVGAIMGGLTGSNYSGGSVMAGGTYLVGEKGPELFTTNRSGTIMNDNLTSRFMGGGQQNVNVTVSVDQNGNLGAFVEKVSNRSIAKAAPSIVNQSVGAVVERTKRGGSMKSTFK